MNASGSGASWYRHEGRRDPGLARSCILQDDAWIITEQVRTCALATACGANRQSQFYIGILCARTTAQLGTCACRFVQAPSEAARPGSPNAAVVRTSLSGASRARQAWRLHSELAKGLREDPYNDCAGAGTPPRIVAIVPPLQAIRPRNDRPNSRCFKRASRVSYRTIWLRAGMALGQGCFRGRPASGHFVEPDCPALIPRSSTPHKAGTSHSI